MRSVVRIMLSVAAALALLLGGASAGLGIWIPTVLDGRDVVMTSPQTIDIPECSTTIIEIADVRVDIDLLDVADVVQLPERITTSMLLRVDGSTEGDWLVGLADQQAVESRLLGARYCLAQFGEAGWSTISVAVEPGAPDARFDGLAGAWARVTDGGTVALPIPATGSSLVVTGSDDSELTTVAAVGEVRIEGASATATVALLGGVITIGIGVALLLISLIGLRRRGDHEG